MARRRYQEPEPKLRGKWWTIRVWRDVFENGKRKRKQKRERLCSSSKKIREVKKISADYLQKINQGLQEVGGATTFKEYADGTYKVTDLPLLAQTTRNCYERMIDNHLKPAFGEMCFREITTQTLQAYFSGMESRGINYPLRVKLRDALSSVIRSAAKYGMTSPKLLEEVTIPPDKRGRKRKPYVTPEQFERIIARISEPYATMVYVAVWTGLRVSELIGLRWRCVGDDSITVEERYCRGDWSNPKTDASAATIGVEPHVLARIQHLKEAMVEYRAGRAVRKVKAVRRSEPDDLVFQSVLKGKPMSDGNVLRRHITPAAKAEGATVNWLVLRRSHATWMLQAGADPKSVQAQMRHARIGTTMEIYAQAVPEAQRAALGKLSEFVASKVVTLWSQKTSDFEGSNCDEAVTIQ